MPQPITTAEMPDIPGYHHPTVDMVGVLLCLLRLSIIHASRYFCEYGQGGRTSGIEEVNM